MSARPAPGSVDDWFVAAGGDDLSRRPESGPDDGREDGPAEAGDGTDLDAVAGHGRGGHDIDSARDLVESEGLEAAGRGDTLVDDLFEAVGDGADPDPGAGRRARKPVGSTPAPDGGVGRSGP